jgi:hypothetical protein
MNPCELAQVYNIRVMQNARSKRHETIDINQHKNGHEHKIKLNNERTYRHESRIIQLAAMLSDAACGI